MPTVLQNTKTLINYSNLQTHKITQIYKTQRHAHSFTEHKDIHQLLSQFFHILITNTKTFKDSNHKDFQQTQRPYTPSSKLTDPTKQTQMKTKQQKPNPTLQIEESESLRCHWVWLCCCGGYHGGAHEGETESPFRSKRQKGNRSLSV